MGSTEERKQQEREACTSRDSSAQDKNTLPITSNMRVRIYIHA